MLRPLLRAAALLALLPLLAARVAVGAVRAALRGRRAVEAGEALTVVIPYPPGERSGGSKAIEGLLVTLARGYRLHVVPLYALNPPAGRLRRLFADWVTLALPMPAHCRPFAAAPGAVRSRITGGDPVVVEFLSGALFLLFGRRPPNALVLREHEPLCRRLLEEARGAKGVERVVAWLRAAVAWGVMLAVYQAVDRVVALTPEDAAFGRRAFPWLAWKVTDIPVALAPPEVAVRPLPRRHARELLMVGNFHHRPNVDALRWFLRACAPHLGPGWTLHLCGLDGPLAAEALPESPVRLVRHGFVEDVEAAFAHLPVAVAPLVSGGGVRMKNLFLASLGKAVVTTTRGNEGIGFLPGVEAVVTDDGRLMAREIARLSADPRAAAAMGRRAAAVVRARFGHDAALARYRAEVFGASPGLAADPGPLPSIELGR